MQNSQLPAKWFKPFAADDGAKVEIPVTTADPTRASQSLGFPPLTMQPPESGGVPPQGEDFNGAMNQVARIVWWVMAGGALPFDAAFAGNANINGYPAGARVVASDYSGVWLSTVENNTVNPDTVGTGWAPGPFYGVTAITGLTNANVTLTPLQAAKPRITLAGTLTGNIQIIVPTWTRDYEFVNSTTGAFTITAKTAAGAGVVIPQNSAPTPVYGDGTNVVQVSPNTAVGTGAQTARVDQMTGRLLAVRLFDTVGAATYTPTAGTVSVVVEGVGGGGGGGGSAATSAAQLAAGSGGNGGAYAKARFTSAFSGVTITIGAGGTAGAVGGNGGAGGASSFGALLTGPGGAGGVGGGALAPPGMTPAPINSAVGTGGNIFTASSMAALAGMLLSMSYGLSGTGGGSLFGAGPSGSGAPGGGGVAGNYGCGGAGALSGASSGGNGGGAGAKGAVIVWEYT